MMQNISKIPGPSPLDVNPSNIYDYCCGSFELVERDISLVLESKTAEIVTEMLRNFLVPAFRVREELINMKKVAYHIFKQGSSIERSLAQVATFFRYDHLESNDGSQPTNWYWKHSDRFTDIANARMRCKGSCRAASDARAIAKNICCIPRYPLEKRPGKLVDMPNNLEVGRFVRDGYLKICVEEEVHTCCNFDGISVSSRDGESMPALWKDKVSASLYKLKEEYPMQFTDEIINFIECIVLCRGGDKALRIVDEVNCAHMTMRKLAMRIEKLLQLLIMKEQENERETSRMISNRYPDGMDNTVKCDIDVETEIFKKKVCLSRGAGIWIHSYINLLSGSYPQLLEIVFWLNSIANVAVSDTERVVFLAGDVDEDTSLPAVLLFPTQSNSITKININGDQLARTEALPIDTSLSASAHLASYRAVELKYRPEMRNIIATTGWPPHVHMGKGICCECECQVREQQRRCPFRGACQSTWFCRHENRCIICDVHSCSECRLLRGDAEAVAEAASRLNPQKIAFDFDRTLCSTKNGAKPITGKHTIDIELISLMWKYSSVVVTRNQNKDLIYEFLVAHGAPRNIEICCVGRKESKYKYIVCDNAAGMNVDLNTDADTEANCSPKQTILFVDDSIQELVDPLIAQELSIHCLLFVRALV